MNYLIIGNGIAGTEAALAIRKNDPTGTITVISESEHHFYYRPKLIDYLAGEITLDKFTLYKPDFYEKNRIEVLLGRHIVSIDVNEHTVADENRKTYSYNKLLIATGGKPFVPPIDGVDREGVFTFRDVADADRIRDYSKGIPSVAVIGGGLLGLETAHSLVKLGKEVTVIETCEWLLPRQLDSEGGKLLQEMLEQKGITFVLNDVVSAIEGGETVTGISLKSGLQVKTEQIVLSTGIRCNSELAEKAGLDTDRGIVVNDYLQTSDDAIYAAGDSVVHQGTVYGIWPAGREQGRLAGLNMSGNPTKYRGTLMSNVLKITGIDLYSAGNYNEENCRTYLEKSEQQYKKFMVRGEQPVSAIVLGDSKAVKIAQQIFEGKKEPEELIRQFT